MIKPLLYFYRQYAVIALGLCAVCMLVFIWLPSARKILIRENNILELTTAIFYVVACFLALSLWRNSPKGKNRNLTLAIGLLSLFGFLEEVSYGIFAIRNLYAFDVPKIYGEHIDALHDFINVVYQGLKVETGQTFFLLVGFIAVGFALGGFLLLKFRLYNPRVLYDISSRYPSTGFLGIWIGLILLASAHDVLAPESMDPYNAGVLSEELLELLGALALLFAYKTSAKQQHIE